MADPYLSEIKYLGGPNQDFIEVAVDSGTDVTNLQVVVYNANGTVRSVDTVGVIVTTVNGKDVYVIDTATSTNFGGLHKHGAVALVDNGTVLSFVSFDDGSPVTATEGAANGMTSTQIGQAGAGESLETTDDGDTYSTQTSPNAGTVPCFVTGTMILTRRGEKPVEQLAVEDQIVTQDRGLQTIRWIGKHDFQQATDQRPICIQKDSFADGVPNRDLYVSPNHRVLIHDYPCSLYFGSNEVLCAAKNLTSAPTIYQSDRASGFAYYHILFDQHEIITSNNMKTESFHPAKIGMAAFEEDMRAEVFGLLPKLCGPQNTYGATVRRCLKKAEASVICNALPYLMPAKMPACA